MTELCINVRNTPEARRPLAWLWGCQINARGCRMASWKQFMNNKIWQWIWMHIKYPGLRGSLHSQFTHMCGPGVWSFTYYTRPEHNQNIDWASWDFSHLSEDMLPKNLVNLSSWQNIERDQILLRLRYQKAPMCFTARVWNTKSADEDLTLYW